MLSVTGCVKTHHVCVQNLTHLIIKSHDSLIVSCNVNTAIEDNQGSIRPPLVLTCTSFSSPYFCNCFTS